MTEGPPSTTGYSSWYVEEYAAEWQSFAAQLTSLICEGVFQRCPELRVSMLEGGFLWLPTWGWRMDKEWKSMRREVPWLGEPPLEIIREHFRFSTAPIDGGPPQLLAKAVEWLNSDDLLMFATDYPHGHDDDFNGLFGVLTDQMKANMMSGTARQWYRL